MCIYIYILYIIIIIGVLPSGRSLAPIPSLLSSLSSSLHLHERTFHEIIYHSSSWPASRPLPQHSSLQHIPPQSIPSKHMSYPVRLPLVYSFYETSVFIHHCLHLFITLLVHPTYPLQSSPQPHF